MIKLIKQQSTPDQSVTLELHITLSDDVLSGITQDELDQNSFSLLMGQGLNYYLHNQKGPAIEIFEVHKDGTKNFISQQFYQKGKLLTDREVIERIKHSARINKKFEDILND